MVIYLNSPLPLKQITTNYINHHFGESRVAERSAERGFAVEPDVAMHFAR
jgi:hypothetical protein